MYKYPSICFVSCWNWKHMFFSGYIRVVTWRFGREIYWQFDSISLCNLQFVDHLKFKRIKKNVQNTPICTYRFSVAGATNEMTLLWLLSSSSWTFVFDGELFELSLLSLMSGDFLMDRLVIC